MTFVAEFKPQPLWQHFDRILTIPRASKDEERMRAYVLERAAAAELDYDVDLAGNVVVRKDPSPGCENAPATVLQSHLDMVQEKNSDVEFDFDRDAIRAVVDGEYLTADGTTLGSDNGIGVAAMLAVMESDELTHGPLELLFTVDEETGLSGAANLDGDLLNGRRLINLDTEEEGALYVGCAGGADSTLRLPLAKSATADGSQQLGVAVKGMKGGHSGVDIHLQRANAVKVLARCLSAARRQTPCRLVELSGGSAHNAIPREASATVAVSAAQADAFQAAVEEEFARARGEFSAVDPGMELEFDREAAPDSCCDESSTANALGLLNALPHGVLAMSYDIPDLVETSTNLATVIPEDDGLTVLLSSRSSVASALTATRDRIRSAAELAGAAVEEDDGYPGWKPDMDSALLATMRGVAAGVYGREPEIKAIHAGLECGILGEKCPGMDMISFGPQIEFPHSPDERVRIASVERFWDLLAATLQKLAQG